MKNSILIVITPFCLLGCVHSNHDYPNSQNNVQRISQPLKKSTALITKSENHLTDSDKYNFIDRNGVKQGLWKEFYKNGKVKEEYYYKNGVLDGKYIWFYPNGNIHDESFKRNGKNDKYFKSYYPDGKLKEYAIYVNYITTKVEIYDQTGNVIHYEIYKNGRPVIVDGDTVIGYK